VNIFVKVRSRF